MYIMGMEQNIVNCSSHSNYTWKPKIVAVVDVIGTAATVVFAVAALFFIAVSFL
jgi:hypothetical protein